MSGTCSQLIHADPWVCGCSDLSWQHTRSQADCWWYWSGLGTISEMYKWRKASKTMFSVVNSCRQQQYRHRILTCVTLNNPSTLCAWYPRHNVIIVVVVPCLYLWSFDFFTRYINHLRCMNCGKWCHVELVEENRLCLHLTSDGPYWLKSVHDYTPFVLIQSALSVTKQGRPHSRMTKPAMDFFRNDWDAS